jgi:hypothetical protein
MAMYKETRNGWIRFESDYANNKDGIVHLSKTIHPITDRVVWTNEDYKEHVVARNEETKVYTCSCGATRRKITGLPVYRLRDSR